PAAAQPHRCGMCQHLRRGSGAWRHSPTLHRPATPPCEPQEKGSRMTTLITSIPKDTVLARLAALHAMPIAQLKQQWRELFGKEPPPFSRTYIQSRLAY